MIRDTAEDQPPDRATEVALRICFVALLFLFGLVTAYRSSYGCEADDHGTETFTDGYGAGDARDEAFNLASVRAGTERDGHAVDGVVDRDYTKADVERYLID